MLFIISEERSAIGIAGIGLEMLRGAPVTACVVHGASSYSLLTLVKVRLCTRRQQAHSSYENSNEYIFHLCAVVTDGNLKTLMLLGGISVADEYRAYVPVAPERGESGGYEIKSKRESAKEEG